MLLLIAPTTSPLLPLTIPYLTSVFSHERIILTLRRYCVVCTFYVLFFFFFYGFHLFYKEFFILKTHVYFLLVIPKYLKFLSDSKTFFYHVKCTAMFYYVYSKIINYVIFIVRELQSWSVRRMLVMQKNSVLFHILSKKRLVFASDELCSWRVRNYANCWKSISSIKTFSPTHTLSLLFPMCPPAPQSLFSISSLFFVTFVSQSLWKSYQCNGNKTELFQYRVCRIVYCVICILIA